MKYWRTQWTDACMLVIVPVMAALLPWPLAWRWLRFWARRPWGPFADAANAALPIAQQCLPIADPTDFLERMRLLWLMDCRDLYASMLRPGRTRIPRYVEQIGTWPQARAFVAMGFHYAIGHDVLCSLAEANRDFTFLSGHWRREDHAGHPVRYWYGRLRIRDVARIGRRPVAYRPGVHSMLESTLRENAVVVALVDVPPRLAPRGRREATLLDRQLSLPSGVIELARAAAAPLVPYWVEFDERMYRRRVCIGEPIAVDDVDAALAKIAEILDRRIRTAPHAWMLWPELPEWTAKTAGAADNDEADPQAL